MSIWPFTGKSSKDNETEQLPKEVKDYYELSGQEHLGVTWLLAFGTLILTIILAFAFFFGVRWVYQKVTHKSSPTAPTQTVTSQNTPESGSKSSSSSGSGNSSSGSSQNSSSSSGDTGTSSTSTSKPSTTAKTTPDTGSGNLVVVFVLGSLAGTSFYYVRQYRRQG